MPELQLVSLAPADLTTSAAAAEHRVNLKPAALLHVAILCLVVANVGRIPVLDHGSFVLYETVAIARYVDEGFRGPPLQPDSAAALARMTQMIGILDSYGYRPMVWEVYVERVSAGEEGHTPDEARIAAGLARSATVLDELEKALEAQGFLAGEAVSLADLHAAPMMAYFRIAPEGAQALARHARLAAWWERMNGRSSLRRTAFARESA